MRITYDKLAEGRRHPLGRDALRARLAGVARESIVPLKQLRAIHFGWNAKTTQEASVVQRGPSFEIRVNFTVEGVTSRLLDRERRWMEPVRRCGGVPDLEADRVSWTPEAAERYCWFLILHELGHLVYAVRQTNGELEGSGGAPPEETFCDQWALARIDRPGPAFPEGPAARINVGRPETRPRTDRSRG